MAAEADFNSLPATLSESIGHDGEMVSIDEGKKQTEVMARRQTRTHQDSNSKNSIRIPN
jgi:hypothetical protein